MIVVCVCVWVCLVYVVARGVLCGVGVCCVAAVCIVLVMYCVCMLALAVDVVVICGVLACCDLFCLSCLKVSYVSGVMCLMLFVFRFVVMCVFGVGSGAAIGIRSGLVWFGVVWCYRYFMILYLFTVWFLLCVL